SVNPRNNIGNPSDANLNNNNIPLNRVDNKNVDNFNYLGNNYHAGNFAGLEGADTQPFGNFRSNRWKDISVEISYDRLLAAIHESAQSIDESRRVYGLDKGQSDDKGPRKKRSRFSALQGVEMVFDPGNREPVLIDEIIEEEDGNLTVCAAAGSNYNSWWGGDNTGPRFTIRFKNNNQNKSYPALLQPSGNLQAPNPAQYYQTQYLSTQQIPQVDHQLGQALPVTRKLPWYGNDSRTYHNCGQVGHTFDTCVNPRVEVCNIYHQPGHTRQTCQLATTAGNASDIQSIDQNGDSVDTRKLKIFQNYIKSRKLPQEEISSKVLTVNNGIVDKELGLGGNTKTSQGCRLEDSSRGVPAGVSEEIEKLAHPLFDAEENGIFPDAAKEDDGVPDPLNSDQPG
ncbi:hypothetical protein KQX54_000181, partial [Cotesia glomerata]